MESEPLQGSLWSSSKPLRIRRGSGDLELLVERDRSVGELLSPDVGLLPNRSQQLRYAGRVLSRHVDGNAMIPLIVYSDIAELLAARKVLARVLSDRVAVLEDLQPAARPRNAMGWAAKIFRVGRVVEPGALGRWR